MMNRLKEVQLGKTGAKFIDGDRSKRYPNRDEFQENGVLFLNAASINTGTINTSIANRISEQKYADIRKGRIQKGDILLTTRGNGIGDVAYVNISEKGLINAQMLIVRPYGMDIVSKFLYYYLSSKTINSYISNFSSGSAQPQIPIRDLRKIPLRLPIAANQLKIAAILTAYDDLIEANRRRIAQLEKMAEELYREWFVRMRFPGYQNTKCVKGVPEGWELVKVENAFEFTGGGTPSKSVASYWNEETVQWFTPTDITGSSGIYLTESAEKCSDEGVTHSSAKLFPAYSVMMTSRATIGAIGINTTEACTNQGFITCLPNARYPLPYLYHWLKLAKPYFEQLCGGATFPELTKGTFKKLSILTPPQSIADSFAQIVNPLMQSVENILAANRNLTQTRDLLLPRLISGKLAVEDLDIQLPPSMREEAG